MNMTLGSFCPTCDELGKPDHREVWHCRRGHSWKLRSSPENARPMGLPVTDPTPGVLLLDRDPTALVEALVRFARVYASRPIFQQSDVQDAVIHGRSEPRYPASLRSLAFDLRLELESAKAAGALETAMILLLATVWIAAQTGE